MKPDPEPQPDPRAARDAHRLPQPEEALRAAGELEHRQAEHALHSERDNLQAVMDGARNFHLVYLDRDFNFVRVNQAYARTCGYRPEEMIGKNHFALYPHAENEVIFARVRDTGQPAEFHDKPFEFPDQPQRGLTYWDWNLTPVKDAAGRVVGLVFALHETTERKRAERALRESEARGQVAEAVQAERQRLQEVLDLLPAYLILLTPDYHVAVANRFFEERFGKAEGRRCYEYLFHRTEPCGNCQTYHVLKTNAPQRWEWTGPDGHDYDIHDFPFTDVDGSRLIMEVGLDITERKQAEAELRQHREHLQELVKERTAALSATNEELARFNRAMVGRELRMIELKQEVNELCARLGQPPRYQPELDEEARPQP
jgi:PAS domain S-box-containing protein